jgi:hypothetical protein
MTMTTPCEITWPWDTITEMAETLRSGTITALIADTGFGKTTLIEQCAQHWAELGISTRIAGTELPSTELLARMAARSLRFPLEHVLRNRWSCLGSGSEAAMEAELARQRSLLGSVSFLDAELPKARQIITDMRSFGAKGGRVYVLDHPGQVDYGNYGPTPHAFRQLFAAMKEVAREFGIAIMLPIQLNRSGRTALHRIELPGLEHAQGSSAIEQMGGTVIMLVRPLLPIHLKNTGRTIAEVRRGARRYADVVDHAAVTFVCLKSRDLGAQQEKQRGQWARRTLRWKDGRYV